MFWFVFNRIFGGFVNSSEKILPLPEGFFGWIKPLYDISEQDILLDRGMDVVVYLRFLKICKSTKYKNFEKIKKILKKY